jgi:tripartite-type tricarboxylate transporter receptor subunit TctC
MVMALAACGGAKAPETPATDAAPAAEAAPAPEATPAPEAAPAASGSGETVKIICPYGAGGIADAVGRKYAEVANSVQSDYNFIVENMTGGDGFAANTFFSEEDPSVKDLLVLGYGACYRHDGGKKYNTEEVDFDVEKNVPFCTIDDRTWILYAKPDTTLADVLAKAKSEGIKMSGGNPLSDPHLALGTLIAAEGGKVQVVPYDGGAEQRKGLTDGEVDVFVGGAQAGTADVEAGNIVPILAFSSEPFEGFVGPNGPISVPCIAGSGMAPELNSANDYSASILPAGGGLATHQGCDEAFRNDMIEVAKKVWASDDFAGWITSDAVLLNHFEKYGDDAIAFYKDARAKGMAAYDLLIAG